MPESLKHMKSWSSVYSTGLLVLFDFGILFEQTAKNKSSDVQFWADEVLLQSFPALPGHRSLVVKGGCSSNLIKRALRNTKQIAWTSVGQQKCHMAQSTMIKVSPDWDLWQIDVHPQKSITSSKYGTRFFLSPQLAVQSLDKVVLQKKQCPCMESPILKSFDWTPGQLLAITLDYWVLSNKHQKSASFLNHQDPFGQLQPGCDTGLAGWESQCYMALAP